MLEAEIEIDGDPGVERTARQRPGLAAELDARLLQMVVVEVGVARRCGRTRRAADPVTWATISVSSAYEAMLKGTPRKTSALRW